MYRNQGKHGTMLKQDTHRSSGLRQRKTKQDEIKGEVRKRKEYNPTDKDRIK